MIPFINRMTDVILSDQLDIHNVKVREVIDEFCSQVDNCKDLFEAFVLMAPGRIRITCKTAHNFELVEKLDFWFADSRWSSKLSPG